MEEISVFLQQFNVVNILIVSVVTTLIVSAINTIENKIHDGYLVLGIGAFVTFLRTQIEGVDFTVTAMQNTAFTFIVTTVFAYLFQKYLGAWLTDKIFGWVKNYIGDKFKPKDTPKDNV